MTMTRLRRAMHVFAIGAALCTGVVPASAQSGDAQLAVIANMATNVFLAVRGGDLPTQELRDAAYGAAISQVMSDAVVRYGQSAAEPAAAVVIVLAAQFHVSPGALGRSLAQYAATAPTVVAQATARAVANEAEGQTTQAFSDTARTSGAASLAQIASGPASVSGVLSASTGGDATPTTTIIGGATTTGVTGTTTGVTGTTTATATNGIGGNATNGIGGSINNTNTATIVGGNAPPRGFSSTFAGNGGSALGGAVGGTLGFQALPSPCPNPSCS